jgi:hypothetical protein
MSIGEWIAVILSPVIGYVVLRILSTAIFRSFFEQKKEFLAEVKYESKRQTKVNS